MSITPDSSRPELIELKHALDSISIGTHLSRVKAIHMTQPFIDFSLVSHVWDIEAYVDNTLFNTGHLLSEAKLTPMPVIVDISLSTGELAQQNLRKYNISDYVFEIYRYMYRSLHLLVTCVTRMGAYEVDIKTKLLDKYFHSRDNEEAIYRILCARNSYNSFKWAIVKCGSNYIRNKIRAAAYVGGQYYIYLHEHLYTPYGYLLKRAHIEYILQSPFITPLLPSWGAAIRRDWPELIEQSEVVRNILRDY